MLFAKGGGKRFIIANIIDAYSEIQKSTNFHSALFVFYNKSLKKTLLFASYHKHTFHYFRSTENQPGFI